MLSVAGLIGTASALACSYLASALALPPQPSAATPPHDAPITELVSSAFEREADMVSILLAESWSQKKSLSFVILVPRYNLMFCSIAKNACSEFNFLVNGLNGMPEISRPWLLSSAMHHFGWTLEAVNEAARNRTWFKAVFLRDPQERLLSGYLSKCVGNESLTADGLVKKHCLGFEKEAAQGVVPAFPAFVDHLQTLDSTGGIDDQHFRQQSDFCGGINVSAYDFIGNLDSDLHPQVSGMLALAGADPSESKNLVEMFFPASGKHLTSPDNLLTAAESSKTTYFSESVESKAGRIYARDYELIERARLR